MPETPKSNVDTWGQAWLPQVDNFSKELSDFLLDEKLTNKEQISNFLVSNPDLKNWFENFLKTANNVQKLKCKKELKNCSTEEEIKSIILENLPEWYNVLSVEVWGGFETVEIPVEDEDFINLTKQARTDTEQARTDTEQAGTDTEQADLMKAKMNLLIKERDDLFKSHPDQKKAKKLDEDTRKEAERVKQQLPKEIKNQLKGKGYDENFINDYILLRVTANEVKNDSSFDRNAVAQFESKVNELGTLDIILKNIDNACNTPDTSLDSFSSENISQTRTELFHPEIWNDSLIQAKQSNLKSRDYSEMLPEMWNEEVFKTYGQFLKWDLKKSWDEYKDNYLWFIDKINSINAKKSRWEELTIEEQNLLSMEWTIKWIKEKMDNDTKNMAEELCIISQIKWMYMCMWEWDNFDLNKAKDIKNENWVLTLNGHIDWVDFAIRQDTKTQDARLQTSQKLGRSADGNVFSIGWQDNFVDSNFILPSQDEIFNTISETVKSGVSLKESQDQSEYLENLQKNIMWKMKEKYKNTEYVHHYMQWQVKWEKVINETLKLISEKSPSIINNETLMKNISQETNKDLFDFMKILKFNIDNSTNTEKDNLNQCITKILEITNNYANNQWEDHSYSFNYPPIIENYLKNSTWLNWWNENSRLSSLSGLFKYYSENSKDTRSNAEWNNGTPSKMIINDLYRDLLESNNWNNKSQTAVKRDTGKKLDNYWKISEAESVGAEKLLNLESSVWNQWNPVGDQWTQ